MNRRPIFGRDFNISKRMAKYLADNNITANQISVFSVIFSLFAFSLMLLKENIFTVFFIILFLILRLCANLLDGMVAIENNKKVFDGLMYNEVPDRISDMFTFIGMGLMIGTQSGILLGAFASSIAIFTAYIRVFGGSLGFNQTYKGYGDKSKRIFISCFCLILSLFSIKFIYIGLILVIILGLQTCYIRGKIIRNEMKTNNE